MLLRRPRRVCSAHLAAATAAASANSAAIETGPHTCVPAVRARRAVDDALHAPRSEVKAYDRTACGAHEHVVQVQPPPLPPAAAAQLAARPDATEPNHAVPILNRTDPLEPLQRNVVQRGQPASAAGPGPAVAAGSPRPSPRRERRPAPPPRLRGDEKDHPVIRDTDHHLKVRVDVKIDDRCGVGPPHVARQRLGAARVAASVAVRVGAVLSPEDEVAIGAEERQEGSVALLAERRTHDPRPLHAQHPCCGDQWALHYQGKGTVVTVRTC